MLGSVIDTIAGIFGIGILGLFTVRIIVPKLNELSSIQPPSLQFPSPSSSAPVQQQQYVPPPADTSSPPSPPTTSSKSSSKPIVTPTTENMTSPNVAGTAFTFSVVGDIDYFDGTAQNLCGDNPTAVLIIGDFSYDTNAQKWWTTTMKPCNGRKNVFGSIGNHDGDGKNFLAIFPDNGGKWTYVKKVGNIAFVALNTGTCSSTCSNPSTEEWAVKQAQNDPSVKWIVVHFHKPIFTVGTAPDAPMSFHTMLQKYPKVKMVFAGHNHKYVRYEPQGGIQYITAGRGGHDASGKEPITKGSQSNTVGVVKCRVGADGAISCQYVANNGTVLDSWGLTAQGKHTGTGGAKPKQGTASGESAYALAQAYYATSGYDYDYYEDKEQRDNAILDMLFQRELILHPRRKFNNNIYHYSAR